MKLTFKNLKELLNLYKNKGIDINKFEESVMQDPNVTDEQRKDINKALKDVEEI